MRSELTRLMDSTKRLRLPLVSNRSALLLQPSAGGISGLVLSERFGLIFCAHRLKYVDSVWRLRIFFLTLAASMRRRIVSVMELMWRSSYL